MNVLVNETELLFYVDTTYPQDNQGLYPIKAKLTCNEDTEEFVIAKIKCNPMHFDNNTQRLSAFAPDNAYINLVLDRILEQYNKVRLESEMQTRRLTANQFKKNMIVEYKTRFDIYTMIDKFVAHYKAKFEVGKLAERTYITQKNMANVWRKFLKAEGITQVHQIKTSTQDALGLYVLRNSKGVKKNNYACSVIRCFKTFLNYCLHHEWITRNPFAKLTWHSEKKEKIYLTEAEIKALQSLDLSNDAKYDFARDCFLFSCATGICFSDLVKVKKEHLHQVENDFYLFVERTKTKIKAYVPLLPEAHAILVKYDFSFPIKSYHTYRRDLKKVCELSEQTKNITTHTGRKTFAFQMLNEQNLPLETVSAMLCHTKTQTTQNYYADVTLTKIRTNTRQLFEKRGFWASEVSTTATRPQPPTKQKKATAPKRGLPLATKQGIEQGLKYGLNMRQLAEKFNVSYNIVQRVKKQFYKMVK